VRLVLASLSGFVVWLCCFVANLEMPSAGVSAYLGNVVEPVFDAPGYSAALLLGVAGFVGGCALVASAVVTQRAKCPSSR
jgi:hypothetical protein